MNADETLVAGTYIEGQGRDYNQNRPAAPQTLDQPRNKGQLHLDGMLAPVSRGIQSQARNGLR